MLIKPGTVLLQRYRILNMLGEGGFATVYLGEDIQLGREVAIKIMKFSTADDLVARFKREAQILANLSHRNIVSVYAFDILEDSTPIVVCEYLRGKSLHTHLNQNGKMKFDELLPILKQTLAGLSYVHKAGIVHRDLSPTNIFLAEEGNCQVVKLLDFGLSKLFSDQHGQTLTCTGEILGNPPYMSPEQVAGQHIDARSDIYSLGTILYECVSGKPAFAADTPVGIISMQNKVYPSQPVLNWQDPEKEDFFKNILLRCLQKEPEKRFQSCREIEQLLASPSSSTSVIPSGITTGNWADAASARMTIRKTAFFSTMLLAGFLSAGLIALCLSDKLLACTVSLVEKAFSYNPQTEKFLADGLAGVHKYNLAAQVLENAAEHLAARENLLEAADYYLAEGDLPMRANKINKTAVLPASKALDAVNAAGKNQVNRQIQRRQILRRIWEQLEQAQHMVGLSQELLSQEIRDIHTMRQSESYGTRELRGFMKTLEQHTPNFSKLTRENLTNYFDLSLNFLEAVDRQRFRELCSMCPDQQHVEASLRAALLQRGEIQKSALLKYALACSINNKDPEEATALFNEIVGNPAVGSKIKADAWEMKAELALRQQRFAEALASVNLGLSAFPTGRTYKLLLCSKIQALNGLNRNVEMEESNRELLDVLNEDLSADGAGRSASGTHDWTLRMKTLSPKIRRTDYPWAYLIKTFVATRQNTLAREVAEACLSGDFQILPEDKRLLLQVQETLQDPALNSLIGKMVI